MKESGSEYRRRVSSPENVKRMAQFFHAKSRLFERYGIILTHGILQDCVKQIQKGAAVHVRRLSRVKSLFLVRIQDSYYPCIYDRNRKSISTFLPQEDWKIEQFLEKRSIPATLQSQTDQPL